MFIGKICRTECHEGLVVGATELNRALQVADENAATYRQLRGEFGLVRPPGQRVFNSQSPKLKCVVWGPPAELTLTIGPMSGIDRQGRALVLHGELTATLEVTRQDSTADSLLVYLEFDDSVGAEPTRATEFTPQVFPAPYRLVCNSQFGIPVCRLKLATSRQWVEVDKAFVPPCITLSACNEVEHFRGVLMSLADLLASTCEGVLVTCGENGNSMLATRMLISLDLLHVELSDGGNSVARVLATVGLVCRNLERAYAVSIGKESLRESEGVWSSQAEAFQSGIDRLDHISSQVTQLFGQSRVRRGEIECKCQPIEPNQSWRRVCLQLTKPLSHFTKHWDSNCIVIYGKASGLERANGLPVHPELPFGKITRRPNPELDGEKFRFQYVAEAEDLNATHIAFFVPPFVTLIEESLRADVLVS